MFILYDFLGLSVFPKRNYNALEGGWQVLDERNISL